MTDSTITEAQPAGAPPWKLEWLTPFRCRLILCMVLVLGFLGHLHYLHFDCPIDLSGDEAQYWDWSRQLDWSYYSKGPLVAWIIRASCEIFGDNMPAVRYPAVVLSLGTSVATYLLTRRLFASERFALGAVLLNHLVPMFVAGSVIMTIDPPFFFCWAWATYFAALAIFDNRRWAWVVVGVFTGIGFLAKYAMFLFLPIAAVCQWRRERRLSGALFAAVIALPFTTPVVLWNIRHGGVSVLHVARQVGAAGGGLADGNVLEFVGSQIGVLGPVTAAFVIAGIVYALRSRSDPNRDKLIFLAVVGGAFFVCVLLVSVFAKAQVNWAAPSYFTLMILASYFLATRLRNARRWKSWRPWFYGNLVFGIVMVPLVHDPSVVYPLMQKFGINPAKADITVKLRGWKLLGERVSGELATLGPGAFVLCDDYMQTAEASFYVTGQPKTYYAGSSFASNPKRHTQYDIWYDRRLDDNPVLMGCNAVYIGKGGSLPAEIPAAFDRVERVPEIAVVVNGVTIRKFRIWNCYGFKGMARAASHGY